MEKLFIVYTFAYSFQCYEDPFGQQVKEQKDEVIIDYELVKINTDKSYYFYTVLTLEKFERCQIKNG